MAVLDGGLIFYNMTATIPSLNICSFEVSKYTLILFPVKKESQDHTSYFIPWAAIPI